MREKVYEEIREWVSYRDNAAVEKITIFFLPDSARLQRREEGKGWGREEGGGLG